MSDKVLYQCARCGNVRLLESFDGLLRFCSDGHEKETMHQVWPSGWISVEGMPDNTGGCVVLVVFPDGFRDSFLAKRHAGEWWVASSAAFWHGTPTYYMPVPTAPEPESVG